MECDDAIDLTQPEDRGKSLKTAKEHEKSTRGRLDFLKGLDSLRRRLRPYFREQEEHRTSDLRSRGTAGAVGRWTSEMLNA